MSYSGKLSRLWWEFMYMCTWTPLEFRWMRHCFSSFLFFFAATHLTLVTQWVLSRVNLSIKMFYRQRLEWACPSLNYYSSQMSALWTAQSSQISRVERTWLPFNGPYRLIWAFPVPTYRKVVFPVISLIWATLSSKHLIALKAYEGSLGLYINPQNIPLMEDLRQLKPPWIIKTASHRITAALFHVRQSMDKSVLWKKKTTNKTLYQTAQRFVV